MKHTPTQSAIAHAIRVYKLAWFTQFTRYERERIIRAYIAGVRHGRGK